MALARDRQATEIVEDEQATAETDLALALGFAAEDRARAVPQDRPNQFLGEAARPDPHVAFEDEIGVGGTSRSLLTHLTNSTISCAISGQQEIIQAVGQRRGRAKGQGR